MTREARPERGEVTRWLIAARDGDAEAFNRLLPLVYDELRDIAGGQLRREQVGHTLDASALVHEAYLKLVDQARVEWVGRAHFLAVAARAMRQVLVDYARRRRTDKRGGGWERTTLANQGVGSDMPLEEVITLHDALDRLAALDDRARQVIEYRFFGGMSEPEIAEVLEVTVRTVQRDWVRGRAWLYREMYHDHHGAQ